jgi:3-oxoacyl-[acyl-carrier protein] reductase
VKFENKVVVVTGGGTGIGKAIAMEFAVEGAFVVIAELNSKTMQACIDDIRAKGGKVKGYQVDVAKRAEVLSFVDSITQETGRIDVLVNNAGITRHGKFLDIDDSNWDDVLAVDLKGVFYCAQAVSPHMVKAGSGKIVNISSISGMGASPHAAGGSPGGNITYAAAKAGVVQLTKTLARELGSHGINVNCVAPGFVLTPLTSTSRSPAEVQEHIQVRSQACVLNKVGSPEDIANAVAFLSSDESSFISGQTLCVDGGRTDKM